MTGTGLLERDAPVVEPTSDRRVFGLGIALVLAPFLVSAIAVLLDGGGALHSDRALMELAVRDVGRHPVLIGLYSRDGWSHPGPLIYYTLAIPYRLMGGSTAGLLVGALAINAAAIAGMATVARRLGGTAAGLLVLVGASVVARAIGPDLLRDPWVCFITVLPFGLFCVFVWAMAEGRAWALPAAAALASWLVQTHVGYAPLTAPAIVLGAVWLVVAAHRSDDPARMTRVLQAAGIAVVAVAVLWIPPLWDQLFASGNLETVIQWFARAEGQGHTVPEGARIVFGQLAAVPDWVTGTRRVAFVNRETTLLRETLWPVLVVPFLAAGVVAWRRGDRTIVRLAIVVAFMLVVAVVAVARTTGTMYEYRLLWTWVLGMLAAVVVVWTVWSVVASRWPDAATKVLVPIALVLLVGLAVAQVVAVVDSGTPAIYSQRTQAVTKRLAAKLERDGGEVLLRSESSTGEFYRQGVLLGLERAGFDARVESDPVRFFGEHRVATGGPVQARLVVLADGDLDALEDRPELELVAYSGRLPLRQRVAAGRKVATEHRRLLAELEAGTLSQVEFAEAFVATRVPGSAVAVFRERAGTG